MSLNKSEASFSQTKKILKGYKKKTINCELTNWLTVVNFSARKRCWTVREAFGLII